MANTVETALFNSANQVKHWKTSCGLGDDNQRPVVFREDSSSHKQIVEISNSSLRLAGSYEVTSGPGKGCRVLVLAPTPTSPFFDLPTELREMIYGYVLSSPEVIELKFCTALHPARVVQKSFKEFGRKQDDWDDRMQKWKSRDRNVLSLLLINKQITAEAIGILYSSNTFRFDWASTLEHFLDMLQRSGKLRLLRHVQLDIYTVTQLQLLITELERIPGLRTLQMSEPRAWAAHPRGPAKLLDICWPILESARGAEQIGSSNRGIEEFITGLCD